MWNLWYLAQKRSRWPRNKNQTHRMNTIPQIWPSGFTLAMALTFNFKGQLSNKLNLMKKRSNCHETKNKCNGWTLDFKITHPLWPWSWTWSWIFKVKGWNCCISGMAGPINLKRKESESIVSWAHNVTLNFDRTHGLGHGFARSNFEIAVSQEWEGRLTLNKSGVSRSLMTVTKVRCKDLSENERGDFRCRPALTRLVFVDCM